MENEVSDSERHFPNHFIERDIGLAEYELSSRKVDGEERAFQWATNIVSLAAPAVWFFGSKINSASFPDWISNGA